MNGECDCPTESVKFPDIAVKGNFKAKFCQLHFKSLPRRMYVYSQCLL